MDELKEKLEEYKVNKAKKMNRKSKWDNWKKTQAISRTKQATNYNKWDFFESDDNSSDDNSEPILPRDDPNFKAMESDMLDRRKRRLRDKKEAE